ncbi:B12-binding domain-containing radical SAM protein [Citrifermentans bremense]|uniref:B12-binding domain-containing radical SAM protein n=1 Tax=Citrifermentans bremense TaxID=60035 RepID=UPI0016248EDB|nr:radical SAM protein [Citrifermentans bremense]
MSAILKQRGIMARLHFIQDWTDVELQRLRRVIEDEHIDFVCFSVVSEDTFESTLPFMESARNMGRVVILGGSYLRFFNEVPDTPAHYTCRGDGETLPEFILHGDTGLFDRALLTEDIDTLPLMDYEAMRPFFHLSMAETFTLPYLSSRDCPWSCSFCAESIHPRKKPRIRARVKEDIEYLYGNVFPRQITGVHFHGDLLPYYNQEWRESWGDITFPFTACVRGDIEPDLVRWLCRRGANRVLIGVEDADEEYRNTVFNKQVTDRQLFDSIREFHKHGVFTELTFIVGAPGQGPESQDRAQKLVKKIARRWRSKAQAGLNFCPYGSNSNLGQERTGTRT